MQVEDAWNEIQEWLIKTQDARTFQEFTGALLESIPKLQELLAGRTPGDEDLTIGGADRDSPMAQIWASIIGRANDIPP